MILRDLDDDRDPVAPDRRGRARHRCPAGGRPARALVSAAARLRPARPLLRLHRASRARSRTSRTAQRAWTSRELPADCYETAATPARAVREARRVGRRSDRDPARHDLGLLHAAGHLLGQAARRGAARPGPAVPDRDHVGARQLRGVPRLAGGRVRRRRQAPAAPSRRADYLPSCWRAGEIIAERCQAAGLDAAECAARVAEARQLAVEAGVARHGRGAGRPPRGVARRRTVSGLLPALVQLPAARLGPVRPGALELRRARRAAALPLRLHRLERQPLARARAPATRRSGAGSTPRPSGRATRLGEAPVAPRYRSRSRAPCR